MSKIMFTLETEDFNFDDLESVEFNFKNKEKYDYTTYSTFDEKGHPIRIVSEYHYREEVHNADKQ